jgi:hypothetical protein
VDSCLHCILVLVSFLRVRAGGVTTARVSMGVCVCVCDGLCMVAVQFKSRARCFWRIRIYGLTLISLSHSSVLVGGVRSEATAQLRPIGWYRPSVGVPGLR